MPTLVAPPVQTPMINETTKLPTPAWSYWFQGIYDRSGGADDTAALNSEPYIVRTDPTGLTDAQILGNLDSGFLKVISGTGVLVSTGNDKIQASELANTAVTAGTYTINSYDFLTVDAQGRLTNVELDFEITANPDGTAGGDLGGSYPDPVLVNYNGSPITSIGGTILTAADAAAVKTALSLNNVENTALSTWAGSTNITTLGTIATGVWSGTAIANNKLANSAVADLSGVNTGDQLVFKTIAVSGQSDVVADTTADTLTLVAGTNMTLTTSAGGDSVTFASSGGMTSPTWSTFSPTVTLVGGAGNTVPVYSTNTGRYITIGKIVHVRVLLNGDGGAEGAGTGKMTIALPVTAGTNPSDAGFSFGAYKPIGYAGNNATEYLLAGRIAGASATTIGLNYFTTVSATASFTGADQNNTARTVSLDFCYEID